MSDKTRNTIRVLGGLFLLTSVGFTLANLLDLEFRDVLINLAVLLTTIVGIFVAVRRRRREVLWDLVSYFPLMFYRICLKAMVIGLVIASLIVIAWLFPFFEFEFEGKPNWLSDAPAWFKNGIEWVLASVSLAYVRIESTILSIAAVGGIGWLIYLVQQVKGKVFRFFHLPTEFLSRKRKERVGSCS